MQAPTGRENPEAGMEAVYGRNARDAARLGSVSKKCSTYLAGLAVLMIFAAAPSFGAVSSSVSGVVRDSSGVPQIGAEVQLLRPDLTVVASVYTDSAGRFLIKALIPGRYALKAMEPSFLPSLRENVKVRGGTVVNLTLNTLYEVLQWLPAEPRAHNAQNNDDWAWTLRSAANRPLLRWLEDGPLMVVTDGPGAAPKLKARLMATGQAGTFGESGERFSTAVEDTPVDSKELLARVDFAPGTDGNMESMLGFRQDLGFAGSVQSVAAVSVEPEVQGSGDQGLDEAVAESSETMHFGDAVETEVGSTAVVGRLAGPASSTASAMLPFATVAWHNGATTVHYRMATMVSAQGAEESEAAFWQPAMAERNGSLTIERGLHQEIGWERQTDASGMAVLVYSDNINNPVMEALDRFAAGGSPAAAVLFDQASNLIRAAGPSFSTEGVQARLEHRIAGENRVRVSYASGSALVMPALPQATSLAEVLTSAHPRRAETYAISLSGTLEGTKTRWQASYRWQPDETITMVSPFSQDASEPFFNVHLSQPIHVTRDGAGGLQALLDIRNLLAEGYRPYILSDGSLLLFAQDQRGVRAGLAFTF